MVAISYIHHSINSPQISCSIHLENDLYYWDNSIISLRKNCGIGFNKKNLRKSIFTKNHEINLFQLKSLPGYISQTNYFSLFCYINI